MYINKNGQAWSFDLMVALVLFIGAFALFFGFFITSDDPKEDELVKDAIKILTGLFEENSNTGIISLSEINVSKLNLLLNIAYGNLKSSFGVKNDFCIYLEDESGNVLFLNASASGKGASNINISGIPCYQ